jgi:peptidoglycan/LPS O-acetylase OafA/YrhL
MVNAWVGLCITLAAAMLSWHIFEKPINALKNRFGYTEKRRTAIASEPAPAATLAVPEA